jgi:hypothetical protein
MVRWWALVHHGVEGPIATEWNGGLPPRPLSAHGEGVLLGLRHP